MLDPSKDKMAYFKDNIQTAEDEEDFDASQYYYNRQDCAFPSGVGSPTVGSMSQSLNMEPTPNMSSAFSSGLFMGRTSSTLGSDGSSTHSYVPASEGNSSASGSLSSSTRPNPFLSQDVYSTRQNGPSELLAMLQKNTGQSPAAKVSPTFSSTINSRRNSSLDMTEFPALATRVGGISLHDMGSGNGGTSELGSGLEGGHATKTSNDQNEFVIQKEDFPALPGFGSESGDKGIQSLHSGSGASALTGAGNLSSNLTSVEANHSSIGSGTPRVGNNNNNILNENKQHGENNNFPKVQQNQRQFDIGTKPNQETHAAKEDSSTKYGLLGLLNVIKLTNKDLVALSLGTDLTALGLDLNSTDCLYSTFASPWADNPSSKEPQFNLPLCYYMQPPVLKTSHLSKVQLETLFYIFYAMPKDVLQAYAAQELYSREWQYHMDLKLWFKRAAKSDGLGNPAGAQYIYFDINGWERRLFVGNILGGLSSGLLREEDVKVKFASG